MLRATAPATEIARLGAALRALARDDAEGFDALFDPATPRLVVSGVASSLAAELRAFGLAEGGDDALQGQHRIRRLGERFYVLELGGTLEYVQDVWPETDALLEVIARAPAALRVADVGTGSGVLADRGGGARPSRGRDRSLRHGAAAGALQRHLERRRRRLPPRAPVRAARRRARSIWC